VYFVVHNKEHQKCETVAFKDYRVQLQAVQTVMGIANKRINNHFFKPWYRQSGFN